jgi:hypothetical protein
MSDFHNLIEREIPRLRRYARALTRSGDRADDLVQDVFQHPIGTPPQCRGKDWNCAQNSWLNGVPLGADRDPTLGPISRYYQSSGTRTAFSAIDRHPTICGWPIHMSFPL